MGAVEQVASAQQSRVAPEATQPRPRRRRPASAWVLMTLAFIVAALATYVAVRDTSPYHLAAVAARDLPAGARLDPDAVTFTELRVADEVAGTLLTREHLASMEGWVFAQPVPAGALVALDALRSPSAPEELRAMSLPLPAERAVAGSIQRGDRIDVIEVRDDAAVYVATDIEVLAVGRPDSGPLAGSGSYTLTVAVDERTALVLARAVESSSVHVVRSTGSAPATVGDGVAPRERGLGDEGVRDGTGAREDADAGGG